MFSLHTVSLKTVRTRPLVSRDSDSLPDADTIRSMGRKRCRLAFTFLLLCVATSVAAQESPPVDTGFSAGKYLHVLAGMSIGLAAASLTGELSPGQSFQAVPWALPLVALGAATVAGIGKELLDLTGFGDPRVEDVLITMSGGLVAAASALYSREAFPPTRDGGLNADLALLLTAAILAAPVVQGFIREIQRSEERRTAAQR
jgi:hypothetical protein